MTVLCPGPVETGFVEASGLTEEEAEGSLPRVMWLPSEAVAKAAVEGMARGRAVVIPGAANKISAVGGYLAPRRLLLPLLAKRHPALRA
jgi:short-subunit dehydrogenase